MSAKRTTSATRRRATTASTAAEVVDELAAVEVEAAAEVDAAEGDLVELHDGAYAIVIAVDPVTVLRLGVPERHDVPFARKVG